MALMREPAKQAREAPLTKGFVRFHLFQRLEHWLLAACFLALVATGLPQKYDDADLSVWIINMLGGIDNARFFHRILATIFVFESVVHMGEIALSILRRRFRPSMVITFQDFREAFDMLRYSVGLIPNRPQFDRYDYRQKFEYWGIVFGAIIMIATGLMLWFPTYVTRVLPGELVPAAKAMHSGEALLALLVIVIWHFYDVVLSPSVFPLDTTMITGKVSLEKLHEEHPREYARLVAIGALVSPGPTEGPPGATLPPGDPTVSRSAGGVATSHIRRTGFIRRSLQWRVIILVSIGMAGILAAFSASSILAINESIDRTLDERTALAKATAGHVDYVMRQGLKVLEESSATEGLDLADSDPEPEERALRQALSGFIFTRVYLTDAEGKVLWTDPLYPAVLGVNVGFSPHANEALVNGRPAISGLSTALADGEPALSMAAPIRHSSRQPAGLIAGDILLSATNLTDMIRAAAVGETGYAQIVDNQGTVLASTRPGELLQQSDHEGLIATLIEERRTSSGTCHGCHESAGEEQRETEVMAFAPLEVAPWGVLIRQSEDEALAPADRLRERAIWFGVPAFFLALLFAWVTARSVLRPVRVLTAAAEKISSGDLSEPVPHLGRDEIGSLARAFDAMRERLKDSHEKIQASSRQLEERVRERTRDLENSRDQLRAVADENAALNDELRRKESARS